MPLPRRPFALRRSPPSTSPRRRGFRLVGIASLLLPGVVPLACGAAPPGGPDGSGGPGAPGPALSATAAATLPASEGDARLAPDEVALVAFLNEARTDPRAFAERHLRERASRSAAARECYVEMKRTPARPRLALSATLAAAARDHALDLGRSGGISHTGSDGSSLEQRVARHGRWERSLGENLAFGLADPLAIVLALLVDEGIADRAHRRNILDPSFTHVGVAVGPHPRFGVAAVVDFAGGVDR